MVGAQPFGAFPFGAYLPSSSGPAPPLPPFRTTTLTGVKDSPASLTGVKDSPATLTGIKDSPATLTGE